MNHISHVCESLAEALVDDPFYQAVTIDSSADEGKRRLILARYFNLAIEEATSIGEVQYAGGDGAAIWVTNEASDGDIGRYSTARTRALTKLLGAAGFDNYVSISKSMAKNVPTHLADAWYLSILGVRPAARGQRLAHRLVELTLSRADRQGATCFLETFNPLSLPFYRRLGFDHEIRCFEEVTARPYWILTRHN
ncbi:GNAT family N-acetyltransferase [Aliidongia dinghuensis]|uniref:GNAT family N-acetyltransferase n=1 Tax=Aliidongia dinghuensis TaxID=1867774 RepID=UPI001662AAB6|nr:GNAT family N-acetyltransferase [Aliidongia dinghuensis]